MPHSGFGQASCIMNPQRCSATLKNERFCALQIILVGNVCQWIIKPLLGLILALTLVPVLGLPHAVGTGIILVSPVSVVQYAVCLHNLPLKSRAQSIFSSKQNGCLQRHSASGLLSEAPICNVATWHSCATCLVRRSDFPPGILCVRRTTQQLCDLSGSPRAGAPQHCANSAIYSGWCIHDACLGAAPAGCSHPCGCEGHGPLHHPDCTCPSPCR